MLPTTRTHENWVKRTKQKKKSSTANWPQQKECSPSSASHPLLHDWVVPPGNPRNYTQSEHYRFTPELMSSGIRKKLQL